MISRSLTFSRAKLAKVSHPHPTARPRGIGSIETTFETRVLRLNAFAAIAVVLAVAGLGAFALDLSFLFVPLLILACLAAVLSRFRTTG